MSAHDSRPRPRPGRGTVFVMRLSPGQWTASWHDGEHHALSEIWGVEVEVLAWARAQDAAEKLVFDWRLNTYRTLPASGPVDVGTAASTLEAEAG